MKRWMVVVLLLAGCSAPATQQGKIQVGSGSNDTLPLYSSSKCHAVEDLPDPLCTPGAVDPAVTQSNIASTICKPGYTDSVRPSPDFTRPLKLISMKDYGFTGDPGDYEYDHLISLELGGAPRDTRNLWPEYPKSPNRKDAVENAAKREVCALRLRLADAQTGIATNWKILGRRLGVPGV